MKDWFAAKFDYGKKVSYMTFQSFLTTNNWILILNLLVKWIYGESEDYDSAAFRDSSEEMEPVHAHNLLRHESGNTVDDSVPARRLGTSGSTCIRDAADFDQGKICTANDVRIGQFTLPGGNLTCIAGTDITLLLRAQVESSPERYDIGFYVDEIGGDAQARGSICYRDFLNPVSTSNNDVNLTSGSGPYYNGEISGNGNSVRRDDDCGDVEAATDADSADTGPCTLGGGTCTFTFYEFTVTIKCRDSDGDGEADVGACVSWDNQIDKKMTAKMKTTLFQTRHPSAGVIAFPSLI